MPNFFRLTLLGLLFSAGVAPSFAQSPAKPANPPKKIHPSLVEVKDVPDLPRVLLIGDSVSMGYTVPVRTQLKGIANVHRPLLNCHNSRQILAELEDYLGQKKWDVIYFNCGGHDFSFRNEVTYAPPPEGKLAVPLDEYQKNLRLIVKRLKKTGAKLIWATTTPMSAAYMQKGYRRESELTSYNAAAVAIMEEEGVAIHDLYALAKPDADKLLKDGVHFTDKGYEFLAKDIAAVIRKELPTAEAKSKSAP